MNGNIEDALEAFQWGLACGAASCMTADNGVFVGQDARVIRGGMLTTLVDGDPL